MYSSFNDQKNQVTKESTLFANKKKHEGNPPSHQLQFYQYRQSDYQHNRVGFICNVCE